MKFRVLPRRALPLLLAVLVTGCGIPADSSPVAIGQSPTPDTTRDVGSSAVANVYFVSNGRLAPVHRRIAAVDMVSQSVQALLNGVTIQEAKHGVRSAIGDGVKLRRVVRRPGEYVTVDMGSAFATVGGSEQALAIAQVVYTVTEVDGGLPVKISLDGSPVPVPKPDGSVLSGPLTRSDYQSLAPDAPRSPGAPSPTAAATSPG